ncbi:ExeM/NucH family extracellular endonuclease [Deinococcus koreensis]|uniref:Endonuclease/exonuclease/phosphatase n=1 Tax=Deinococcus koreensis TaxID=2054903 RepID=A0A2K3V0G4_9DEIO|nr:ExeM/NucH family extracellular endonuclease [Deinococcus koreensis]PNY82271.1 endonuclease/exonuclease/phosphatase [Deinococcus koreensis]
MRPSLALSIACSLLLASCGSTQTALSPSAAILAQTQKVAVLSVPVAAEVKFVELILTDKKGAAQTFSAVPADGSAVFQLGKVGNGDFQAAVRAYDASDKKVVLYKGAAPVNLKAGTAATFPALTRVSASVTVNATPTLDKTATFTAKLGETSLPMTVAGGVASVKFADVPTARSLSVTVQGKASDGQPTQTGSATFTLGDGGATVPVTLSEIASCPVVEGAVTAIPAIQGSGAASPLVGQSVTVRGVVTSDLQSGLGGFYVQDAAGDSDPATSDGVFVFTGLGSAAAPQPVAVGDLVQFTGTVKEFKSPATATESATQLDTVSNFVKCAPGLVVKPVEVKAPFNDLERYEGMLVTFPEKLTVTDNFSYGRFGELGLSAGGRLFNPTNGNVSPAPSAAELAARRIILDDRSSRQNPATVAYLEGGTRRTGDTVTGLTGALHFANNAFKVQPTADPVFVNENPRSATPKAVGGTLTVAGANVLNYFTTFGASTDRGASSAYEFGRQKTKVIAALKGLDADIVTLMEVQNNGDAALNDLVAGLNTAYGAETYKAVQTGVIGTDAIKVAIIYKPARVRPVGSFAIDPNPVYSRPPLAQSFQDLGKGGVLTVVANHFKSKGSCPTSGDVDTGQGCWNQLRVQQSQALLSFAQTLKTRVNDQDVLIMGDLNAYGQEDPINTIVAGGYASLNLRIPEADRYSYQFGGLFGYLDHALATTNLNSQVTGITEWHINADEPVFIDYNVEFKNNPNCVGTNCTSPDLYTPDAFRASDHDPVLVGLNLSADTVTEPVTPLSVSATGPDTVTAGQPYTLSVGAGGTPDSLKVNWGDGSAEETLAAGATSAAHTYASAGPVTITVTATRGAETKTATKSVTVNSAPVTGAGRLVISQVYGGGGNTGAPFTNDFIEIFNAGSGPVNLNGYSVQYASATGTSWAVTPLGTVNLAAGQYYLVQGAAGTTVTNAPLPTPDVIGTTNLSGTNGKVALASSTVALTGINPVGGALVDLVGYGSANGFEGNAAPALSNTTAGLRAGNGCTDTNQNGADFAAGAPTPRTTASPANICP